jgi:hypothetical protein
LCGTGRYAGCGIAICGLGVGFGLGVVGFGLGFGVIRTGLGRGLGGGGTILAAVGDGGRVGVGRTDWRGVGVGLGESGNCRGGPEDGFG